MQALVRLHALLPCISRHSLFCCSCRPALLSILPSRHAFLSRTRWSLRRLRRPSVQGVFDVLDSKRRQLLWTLAGGWLTAHQRIGASPRFAPCNRLAPCSADGHIGDSVLHALSSFHCDGRSRLPPALLCSPPLCRYWFASAAMQTCAPSCYRCCWSGTCCSRGGRRQERALAR